LLYPHISYYRHIRKTAYQYLLQEKDIMCRQNVQMQNADCKRIFAKVTNCLTMAYSTNGDKQKLNVFTGGSDSWTRLFYSKKGPTSYFSH